MSVRYARNVTGGWLMKPTAGHVKRMALRATAMPYRPWNGVTSLMRSRLVARCLRTRGKPAPIDPQNSQSTKRVRITN